MHGCNRSTPSTGVQCHHHSLRLLPPPLPPAPSYSNPTPTHLTFPCIHPSMADRNPTLGPRTQRPSTTTPGGYRSTLLRRLHDHVPNSTQLIGFLTLAISGSILLLLTGLTLTATVLGLIFFTPLILLSCPIWLPVGTVVFIAVAGFLSVCGFGVAAMTVGSWLYKYFRRWHPSGSDRVNYARIRIADTASHFKDYMHSKVKDAAPGA